MSKMDFSYFSCRYIFNMCCIFFLPGPFSNLTTFSFIFIFLFRVFLPPFILYLNDIFFLSFCCFSLVLLLKNLKYLFAKLKRAVTFLAFGYSFFYVFSLLLNVLSLSCLPAISFYDCIFLLYIIFLIFL